MQKFSRRQHFMLTLPGLVLLAAFLIGGGAKALSASTPTAFAANSHDQPETHPQSGGSVQVSQSVRTPTTELENCPALGEHRGPSFGSAVVVTSNEVICSDLTSFGGRVTISGEVDGNVVTFGGNVVVAGRVNGNVTLYGGNLNLQEGAHINGDIHVCGGQWAEDANSELHGNVFACTESIGELFLSDGGASFHFWFTLAWIILGMLLITLLPEHVMFVRSTVQNKAKRSLALGFLTILLAPAILAVLIALIISIPLAILVAVVLLAGWALGTVAIGTLIGDRLLRSIAPQHNTRLTQLIVGIALLTLVGSLPVIGFITSIGTGLLGIGAVFLSRFGTRLYQPPRQPLSF
jgi:hypothetical protein